MKKIYHRNFIIESNDFQNMVRLQTNFYREGNHDWTLGRLYAWRYGLWTPESRNPEIFSKSVELFLDENEELQAFIISEECGGNVVTLFAPHDEQLLEKMICFLDEKSDFEDAYSIYCSEDKLLEIELLRKHGYCIMSDEDITFEYQAKDIVLPTVDIPHGYILTDENLYLDIEKMERFRFSVFNPGADFNEEIAWAYRYSRRNPFIKKELNIVLLDENKNPVSSCIGYFDTANLDIEIEVVCTKREEEGKGFAKIVISECIQKALKMGAKKINISGWNELTKHLYSNFGECNKKQKICIKKKYE